MGACGSTESGGEDMERKKRSQAIDKKLEEDSRRLRKECKILLLGSSWPYLFVHGMLTFFAGSGESGKSTIVKQMKIIHQNGYTQDELALYRLTIYKNLIDCMKALIGAMHQFEIEPHGAGVKESMEYVMEYNVDPDPDTPLNPQAAEAVIAIWHDGSIPAVMEHQSEFYLMDSAP
jgi:guanine nucleotide-binding protein G(i) subunit alpha